MLQLLTRVQLAYMGLFVIVCAAVVGYQAYYVWPAEHCESRGGWWSPKYHMCATPMPIWRFTGRLPKAPATAKPA